LANIASARKRARQSEKSRQANASKRSLLRSSIRKVIDAANNKDKDAATAALQKAVPVIDRMVNKGIIHRNKAARHKQQLNNLVREL